MRRLGQPLPSTGICGKEVELQGTNSASVMALGCDGCRFRLFGVCPMRTSTQATECAVGARADVRPYRTVSGCMQGAAQAIPYGETRTYADLARATQSLSMARRENVGRRGAVAPDGGRSARAVGNALAANPLPLLVPCHRVIRGDGTSGGFMGGGDARLKVAMLALEAGRFGRIADEMTSSILRG